MQKNKNKLSKKDFKEGKYTPDYNIKPYTLFASYYDDAMVYLNYKLWLKYINNAISFFEIDCKNLLELASGTGHLASLLSGYYKVIASDNSKHMIQVMKMNFPFLSIFQLDMKNFSLNNNVDVVVSFNDNVNYIFENKELYSHFRSVFNVLNKKGMFIFDATPAYNIEKNFIGNVLLSKTKKNYVRWETVFVDNKKYINAIIDIFDIRKNKIYRENHIQKLHDNALIIRLLKEAGFNRIYNYDGFTFYPPKTDSEHLHFIALKD